MSRRGRDADGCEAAVTWFARHVARRPPASARRAPEGCPLLRHQQQSPPRLAPLALFCYSVSVLAAPRPRASSPATGWLDADPGTPEPRNPGMGVHSGGPVIKQPRAGQIESVEETRDRRRRGDGQLAATIAPVQIAPRGVPRSCPWTGDHHPSNNGFHTPAPGHFTST